jgi:hypothetical protein
VTLQQQIRRNRLRSSIVVIGFVLLIGVVAGLIGAVLDLRLGVVALIGSGLYAIYAIISSRRIVARMTGAHERLDRGRPAGDPGGPDRRRPRAERVCGRDPAADELPGRDDGPPARDAEA